MLNPDPASTLATAPAHAGSRRPGWHSVSSTREYERCPRRYWYGYVARIPTDRHVPPSWRIGTAVHAALEAAYRHRQTHPTGALSCGLPAALVALRGSWDTLELPHDDAYRRAGQMVERTLQGDVLAADRVLGVEVPLRAELTPGHLAVGFADLILERDDTMLEIVDHKVTSRRVSRAELAGDLQLNLYGALALTRWPDTTVVRATHHYPTGPEAVSVTLTRAGMATARTRILTTAAVAMADEVYEPTPGPACDHCPWQPRCPAGTPGR